MKLITLAVLLAFSSSSFATPANPGNNNGPDFAGGSSAASASAAASSTAVAAQGQLQGQIQGQGQLQGQTQHATQGNNQAVTSNDSTAVNTSNVSNYQRAPVATAFAAPLTSGIDTCMGSSSMGIQGIGFGVSVGSTWTDDNCKRLKNSVRLQSMGFNAAALALMCQEPTVSKAMRVAGTPCKE
jgi:hypothetical protein